MGDAAISIETRLSNGLEKLQAKEADTVIIAGMGGELEISILEAGSSYGAVSATGSFHRSRIWKSSAVI